MPLSALGDPTTISGILSVGGNGDRWPCIRAIAQDALVIRDSTVRDTK